MNTSRCVITPVNLITRKVYGNTAVARQDYNRERLHFGEESEFNPKWDDSVSNTAEVGDKFAFVQNTTDTMEIFTIIAIIPAEDRPDYWDLPHHQRRRVLILSKREKVIRFSDYKRRVGYSPNMICRGTQRAKW